MTDQKNQDMARILEKIKIVAQQGTQTAGTDVQKKSYEKFLQANVVPEERENIGLQEVFKSVFPITDFNETATLEFVSYHLEKPKYMVDECRQRGMTYASPMKVVIRLVVWDKDEELGTQTIRDVKEQ